MAEQQTQTQTDVTTQLHKIKFLFLNSWEQFEQLTDKDKYFYYYVMFADGTMWTQGVRYNKFIAGKGITINGNTISISGSYAPQVPNIEKYIPATGDIIQYTGQDTTHDNMQLKNGRFYKFNGTNWIPQPVTDIELTPEQMAALKGDKGDKGDSFKYEDFTPEQLATLKGAKGDKGDTGEKGADGAKGDKGDPFKYSDFTTSQLAALKGEKGADGTKGDKGDSFKYEDFTPEQLAALKGDKGDKGDSFKYEDFTPEQLAALKGEKGDKGDKGDGVEYTAGFGITIQNNVISITDKYTPQVSNISDYVAKEGDVIFYTGEDTETLKYGKFYKFENLEWKPISQDNNTTYTAGEGIKIEENVISTTGKYTPQVSDITNFVAKEGDLIQYTGEDTEKFKYGEFYKYENSEWKKVAGGSNKKKVTKFFSANDELEENEVAQYQGETDEENGLINWFFYKKASSNSGNKIILVGTCAVEFSSNVIIQDDVLKKQILYSPIFYKLGETITFQQYDNENSHTPYHEDTVYENKFSVPKVGDVYLYKINYWTQQCSVRRVIDVRENKEFFIIVDDTNYEHFWKKDGWEYLYHKDTFDIFENNNGLKFLFRKSWGGLNYNTISLYPSFERDGYEYSAVFFTADEYFTTEDSEIKVYRTIEEVSFQGKGTWQRVDVQPNPNTPKILSLSNITDLSDLISANQLKENDLIIVTDIEENKDYSYSVNGKTKTFRGNPDFDLMFRCATNNEFKPIMFSPIV